MKTAFIIHGIYGHPQENWFPWLKQELESRGWTVFVPAFPTPENQTLESWMDLLEEYREHINKETIFIGHSLGVAFVLSVLEKLDAPISAAYFVAGFASLPGNEFDGMMKPFVDRKFGWAKIRKNCKKFVVFASDNDPYVPLEKGKELADALGAELMVVKGAGHFNEKAGYRKFPLLLKSIVRA